MDKSLNKKMMENDSAGRKCSNAQYLWHKVDGCCKECRVHVLTDAQIQARRTKKGYR